MTSFWKEHPTIGALSGVVLALVAVTTTQYARDSWPFSDPDPEAPSNAPDPHASHGGAAPLADTKTSSTPAGYAAVALDASQATALGLTTDIVAERDFTRSIRTVGVVTFDETRTAHVHSRVRGWIEGIHVDFVGRKVRAGERLISIYSQEVYAAELELASLVLQPQTARPLGLLEAARRRLSLWEVPASIVAKVEATGEPQRTFPLLAPRAGTVVAKQAVDGLYIDPSLELYTISDLSRVWVLADVYAADVPHVMVGSTARLTIEGQSVPVSATVAFLAPTIDERTRTRKVRFEMTNKDGRLLPGAFVTAELELAIGKGLAVPESAVIRTGARAIVFVIHGTHAEPREVTLGPLVGAHYRVTAGLVAGDRVATGAQFLLDSESRLRASRAPGGHAGH